MDVGEFQEIQYNWSTVGTVIGFYDLINMEVTTRNRTGKNSHEEVRRLKHGGTSIYSFDIVSSQVVNIGSGESGIGRQTRMR